MNIKEKENDIYVKVIKNVHVNLIFGGKNVCILICIIQSDQIDNVHCAFCKFIKLELNLKCNSFFF